MDKKPKKPLKRFHAILLAITSRWLLGVAGIYILLKCHRWSILGVGTIDDTYVNFQIAMWYVASIAALMPAAVSIGSIISFSDFKRPFLVAFIVSLGYQVVGFVSTLLRWTWSAVGIDPTVPVYGELAGLFLLPCFSLFGVWWAIGPIGRFLNKIGRKRQTDGAV